MARGAKKKAKTKIFLVPVLDKTVKHPRLYPFMKDGYRAMDEIAARSKRLMRMRERRDRKRRLRRQKRRPGVAGLGCCCASGCSVYRIDQGVEQGLITVIGTRQRPVTLCKLLANYSPSATTWESERQQGNHRLSAIDRIYVSQGIQPGGISMHTYAKFLRGMEHWRLIPPGVNNRNRGMVKNSGAHGSLTVDGVDMVHQPPHRCISIQTTKVPWAAPFKFVVYSDGNWLAQTSKHCQQDSRRRLTDNEGRIIFERSEHLDHVISANLGHPRKGNERKKNTRVRPVKDGQTRHRRGPDKHVKFWCPYVMMSRRKLFKARRILRINRTLDKQQEVDVSKRVLTVAAKRRKSKKSKVSSNTKAKRTKQYPGMNENDKATKLFGRKHTSRLEASKTEFKIANNMDSVWSTEELEVIAWNERHKHVHVIHEESLDLPLRRRHQGKHKCKGNKRATYTPDIRKTSKQTWKFFDANGHSYQASAKFDTTQTTKVHSNADVNELAKEILDKLSEAAKKKARKLASKKSATAAEEIGINKEQERNAQKSFEKTSKDDRRATTEVPDSLVVHNSASCNIRVGTIVKTGYENGIEDRRLAFDALEQFKLLNSLRVRGVVEKEGENTNELVVALAAAVNVRLKSNEIEQSRRIGKYKEGQCREVFIRFKSIKSREKLYTAKNLFRKLPGYEDVFVNEALTAARQRLLFEARTLYKADKLKRAWSNDGEIFVKDMKHQVHKILCNCDLEKFRQ